MTARPDPKVVFVCPHGAAKSVLAGSCFNRLAERHGLALRAIARGTDPDEAVAERVRQQFDGALCTPKPVRFAASDVRADDLLIVFDLTQSELGAEPDESWNALPALSEDFEAGRAAIESRVERLVAELGARPASS